jgi:GT2 family glycosyltransferase
MEELCEHEKDGPATLRRPVTIVVPVYGDLPTLTACVDSLKENVDLQWNRVLLINDCGPDVDIIETSLLAQIEDWDSIRYERNDRNLGFVGTCNRAVSELDTTDNDILLLNSDTLTTPGFLEELSSVLHLSPHHGIVCARSNDAWVASFPHTLRNPSSAYGTTRTAEVHAALSDRIRRYSISPVALGFCFLVRRELIARHGLFDHAFAPGYFEEFDFCLRMNEFGYSSVIANRAMVFHTGARSFVETKSSLMFAHEKTLVQRFPFYRRAMQVYLLADRDPVDVFADALVPADDVRRLLVDVDVVPTAGLAEDTRALLAGLQQASEAKYLVASLSVPEHHRDRISTQYPALQVISHARLDQLWDVAIASSEAVSLSQLIRLNRVSPRWVFTSTDISSLRTWRTRVAGSAIRAPAEEALRHADGILALRKGLKAELESYAGKAIVLEFGRINAQGMVQEIAERFGRSAIDIERLRVRWDYFARDEPVSFIRRLVRGAESAAPLPVGYVKRIVRRLCSFQIPALS